MRSLTSGYQRRRLTVQPQGVLQTETFAVSGVGLPMTVAGTQRNALAPELSLWAGIRTYDIYQSAQAPGLTYVWAEAGIIPYEAESPGRAPRNVGHLTPGWGPIGDGYQRRSDGQPTPNILTYRDSLPWPPGGLVVRVSWYWDIAQDIGDEVDAFVAWSASGQAVYPLGGPNES